MNHNYWIIEQKKVHHPHKFTWIFLPQISTNFHKLIIAWDYKKTDLIHLNRAYTQIENSV